MGISETVLDSARAAIDELLTGMRPWVVVDAPKPPAPPDLSPLSAAGAAIADEATFAAAMDTLSSRRSALLALVINSGHKWASVTGSSDEQR